MTCQVADLALQDALPCPARESGGVRCEREHSDGEHWISPHTIEHALAGNGYPCAMIGERK